jgi:hypothetical protein
MVSEVSAIFSSARVLADSLLSAGNEFLPL